MTEYELVDNLNTTVGLIVEIFALYLTATSAYLITAYAVGARLSSIQCTIVSVLYIATALTGTFALFFMGSHAIDLVTSLQVFNPEKNYGMQPAVRNVLAAVCFFGVPTCLKFMWDIRRKEDREMANGDTPMQARSVAPEISE
jgi:hypothetical protein